MKLIAIVGTNSNFSTNRLLLQSMQQHFVDKADIEIAEIKELPAFNEPKGQPILPEVQALADKITAADGVIISVAEYDHAITASLKSALEWLSYGITPFIDVPVMITGASYGALGSSRAQSQLRQILDSPEIKARIMPSSEFFLSHSGQAFDDNGNLVYTDKVKELDEIFTEFLNFIDIVQRITAGSTERKKQADEFSWIDTEG